MTFSALSLYLSLLADWGKPNSEPFSYSCAFFLVLANRLTVAVSDVLNPNLDDMSRGVGPLGYGTTQGDFSPQVSLDLHVIASVSGKKNGFRKICWWPPLLPHYHTTLRREGILPDTLFQVFQLFVKFSDRWDFKFVGRRRYSRLSKTTGLLSYLWWTLEC